MSHPLCNSNSGSTNQRANVPVKHIKVDAGFKNKDYVVTIKVQNAGEPITNIN